MCMQRIRHRPCKAALRRNPSWTHKASILSEFGTEQLELIYTSAKTGNPEYAQKTEAVIAFLNRLFPDKVRPHVPMHRDPASTWYIVSAPQKWLASHSDSLLLQSTLPGHQGRHLCLDWACILGVLPEWQCLNCLLQGLLPLYIHPASGEATTQMVSMGAMGDSYYEYLLKARDSPSLLLCTASRSKHTLPLVGDLPESWLCQQHPPWGLTASHAPQMHGSGAGLKYCPS